MIPEFIGRFPVIANVNDLKKEDNIREQVDTFFEEKKYKDDYFYLTPTILHIDSSDDYLKRCLKYYKKVGISAYGILNKENDLESNIIKYLNEIKPDIYSELSGDKYLMPVTANIHHAVCDGYNICKFFEDLQEELNDVVKNWLVNKIEKIDNKIKEL